MCNNTFAIMKRLLCNNDRAVMLLFYGRLAAVFPPLFIYSARQFIKMQIVHMLSFSSTVIQYYLSNHQLLFYRPTRERGRERERERNSVRKLAHTFKWPLIIDCKLKCSQKVFVSSPHYRVPLASSSPELCFSSHCDPRANTCNQYFKCCVIHLSHILYHSCNV